MVSSNCDGPFQVLFGIVDDPFWEREDNIVALKSIIERKMSFGSKFAIINHFFSKLLAM
jgi:hypothetical protein